NIEIKSRPEWDDIYTPPPAQFAKLVAQVVQEHGVAERVTIQSFDVRSLEAMHTLHPDWPLALLVENTASVVDNLARLSFQPTIYSPYFLLCSQEMRDTLQDRGIQLIPWTVNEVDDMRKLLELGVDGIITDYPNRIGEL
ncbi:MAG: glycerophosphodiester phosphodiesterase, partial [Bacteroidetes bacterium]